MRILARRRRRNLPQRRQVVQNPERAPVRRRDQVVVFHFQIVHRHGRQVLLQRFPVRAVVERHQHSRLRPRVEQPFAFRVLAHHAAL